MNDETPIPADELDDPVTVPADVEAEEEALALDEDPGPAPENLSALEMIGVQATLQSVMQVAQAVHSMSPEALRVVEQLTARNVTRAMADNLPPQHRLGMEQQAQTVAAVFKLHKKLVANAESLERKAQIMVPSDQMPPMPPNGVVG